MQINNKLVSYFIDNSNTVPDIHGNPHKSLLMPLFKDGDDIHAIRLTTQPPKLNEKLVIKIDASPITKISKESFIRLDGTKSNFHILKESNCSKYNDIHCQIIESKYRKDILKACLNSKFMQPVFHSLIKQEVNKIK